MITTTGAPVVPELLSLGLPQRLYRRAGELNVEHSALVIKK